MGAAGFLAGRIAEHLTKQGHEVVGLWRQTPRERTAFDKCYVEAFECDVTNVRVYERFSSIDAVVYTVSLNHHDCEVDPTRAFDVNVKATMSCVNYFANRGISRFIYFSTQQVYGPFEPTTNFSEDSEPSPRNIYGMTHFLSEKICHHFHERGPLCMSIRLSNAVGAPIAFSSHFKSLVLPDFCISALADHRIVLNSDGTPQRNFIAVDDVCRAVEFLLKVDRAQVDKNIFNLGSSETLTLAELARVVANEASVLTKSEIDIVRFDRKEFTVENTPKFTFESTRLKNLGFQIKGSVKQSVRELLEALRE